MKEIFGCAKVWKLCSGFLLLIALLSGHRVAVGQAKVGKPVRILFLVDGSSSMLNDWQGSINRFSQAGNLVKAIADSVIRINPNAEFALRVFGHQYPAQQKNCFDTRLEVTFKKQNSGQLYTRMSSISPLGASPIAYSLRETALEDFENPAGYAYSVILITDGAESCDGDICATMQKLLLDKISFKPYILSLIDYAPLRDQYSCLGNYLTVATEADVAPAIRKIIDDNRPVITQTGLPQAIVFDTPKAVVPPVVAEPPKPAATVTAAGVVTGTRPVRIRYDKITVAAAPLKVPALPLITGLAVPAVPGPVTPAPGPKVVATTPIAGRGPGKIVVADPKAVAKVMNVPRLPAITNLQEAIEPVINTLPAPAIKTSARPIRLNILFALANANTVKVPALPAMKGLVTTAPVTPPTPVPAPAVKTDADVTSAPSDRTTISVFFTNGKGKFYATEPDMIISDAKTHKQVLRQFRTVDYNGTPEPIELAGGTYDITFPNSTNKATNVVVKPNAENRVEIVVNSGALSFYYKNNSKRPVKEYTAYVSNRFEGRINTVQKCDTILPYEPANYHIEINTLPPTILNTDITFGSVSEVSIQEPGTIQVNNTEQIGRIEFWRPLGDQYVRFYEMNILGDPENQVAHFLPGPYELRYVKPTGGPVRKVTVVPFRIVSNETVSLMLDK